MCYYFTLVPGKSGGDFYLITRSIRTTWKPQCASVCCQNVLVLEFTLGVHSLSINRYSLYPNEYLLNFLPGWKLLYVIEF